MRFKLSSSKYSEKKFDESRDNLLNYYNSLGFRDAVIEKDTLYHNAVGNLNIDIQLKEGRKYFWKYYLERKHKIPRLFIV